MISREYYFDNSTSCLCFRKTSKILIFLQVVPSPSWHWHDCVLTLTVIKIFPTSDHEKYKINKHVNKHDSLFVYDK